MRRRAWKSVKSEARRLTNKAGGGRRDAREKPTSPPTAPEMVGTTGQATKFGPNLAKSEMETKPSWRWGKEKTSPGSIPFPAQRSQLPGQSLEGSPGKGDPPGVGGRLRPPRAPGSLVLPGPRPPTPPVLT